MYIWNGLIFLGISIGYSLSYCCGRLQLAWPGDSGDHVHATREHVISHACSCEHGTLPSYSVFYNGGGMLILWEAHENIFYDTY